MADKLATDRRSFLKLAGVGAAGAVAAASGSATAVAQEQDTGSVYRETDHVRKVYELQRF